MWGIFFGEFQSLPVNDCPAASCDSGVLTRGSLCLLILLNLLCLGSPFRRLQVRSSHCFWCLPPVDKVGSGGCVGFLVEGSGACVLVDEAGSCLSGGRIMSSGVFWGVCNLIMILGSLSANGRGCFPVLLVVWCRVSSTVVCWSLSSAGS